MPAVPLCVCGGRVCVGRVCVGRVCVWAHQCLFLLFQHTRTRTKHFSPCGNFPQTRQEQAESAHYSLMSCLISTEYKSLIVKSCMFILINYCTKVSEWRHNDMGH